MMNVCWHVFIGVSLDLLVQKVHTHTHRGREESSLHYITLMTVMFISGHYHIFVGDLSPDVETHQLREAFAPFGQTTYV